MSHLLPYTKKEARRKHREAMSADDDFAAPVDLRMRTLRNQFAVAVADVLDGEGEAEMGARSSLPLSKAFAQQLTETTWMWATTALAPDLERFAKHAKRTVIKPEDVVLAARKNEVTHVLLDREAQRLCDKRQLDTLAKRQKVGEGSRVSGP